MKVLISVRLGVTMECADEDIAEDNAVAVIGALLDGALDQIGNDAEALGFREYMIVGHDIADFDE